MKRVSLDTNAYSNFIRGNKRLLALFEEAELIFVSAVVIGELMVGFLLGSNRRKNEATLSTLLSKPNVRVLDVTVNTAHIFAQLKAKLQKKGKPIPINDLWIAAHSIESRSLLVTFDKHFKQVSGLKMWQ